jgi:hypothetical protein
MFYMICVYVVKKQKIANYKYMYSSLKKYKPYYLSPIKNLNL